MKKSPSLLVSLVLIPTVAAALSVVSCGGAEMPSTNAGSGGSSGTGNSSGSGGNTSSSGSGGSQSAGSGGSSSSSGSGGSSTSSGSGGSVITGGGTGGTSSGSGGATGSGTGGTVITGAGTGGTTTTGGGALMVTDGYAKGGTWMGYAYSFVGPMTGSKAMVTPASFMGMTQLCINGSITADTTYASVAGMGWNVNQALGTTSTSPPIMPAAISGSGLTVNVSSTGLMSGQLRAQIKGTTGDYCATIGTSGATTVPWAMFNSKCWDGTGTKFSDTSISAVELVIPSAATALGPFMVCLLDAHP